MVVVEEIEIAIQTQPAKSGELLREISAFSYNSNASAEAEDDSATRDLKPMNVHIVQSAVRAPAVRKVQTPNGWLQCASFGEPIRCKPHVTRGINVAGFIPLKCPLSDR